MTTPYVIQKLENSGIALSPNERSALDLHLKNGDHPLSPKTSAEFLQLFLNGYTTSEIQKLNPGFKLGIIVNARIEHDWDKHKSEYINVLMTQTRETVQKSQLEAIRFAADGMTVYHKILGTAFKKYLQSGREEDLGDYAGQINIRNYKEYVSLLMQLTGQDNAKKVSGEIHHTLESQSTAKTIDVGSVAGSDLLKLMENK